MMVDEKINLIVIGESNVGKTSILQKYKSGYFTNQSIPTIGCDYVEKIEKIDGKNVKVKIWDTSGQERYRSLTKNFYSQADGVLIVYDITERTSFDRVRGWIDSVLENKDAISMILLGNKIDLDHREVQTQEGKAFAEKSNNIPFFETSAKENICIDECIMWLVREVMNSDKRKNTNKSKDVSFDFSSTTDRNSYLCCYS